MRFTKWTGFVLGSFILASAASAAAQVVVQVRPPRPIVERRGPTPGRGYVWVPGYQRWNGRGYVWAPGQWQRPPRARAHWVPGKWVRHGHGWEFREGYWR
jgi:WXXGXW repeat (2 copies)